MPSLGGICPSGLGAFGFYTDRDVGEMKMKTMVKMVPMKTKNKRERRQNSSLVLFVHLSIPRIIFISFLLLHLQFVGA